MSGVYAKAGGNLLAGTTFDVSDALIYQGPRRVMKIKI